jgi:hypothetical protein
VVLKVSVCWSLLPSYRWFVDVGEEAQLGLGRA